MTTVCNAPRCEKVLVQTPGKREKLYCDATCRNRAAYARKHSVPVAAAAPASGPPASNLADVVRRQLEQAGRLETIPGQLALELAQRLVSAGTTASSLAQLSKELRALVAEALEGTKPREGDALDEFTLRLQQKAASA